MEYAYPLFLIIGIPALIGAVVLKLFWQKPGTYTYSLTSELKKKIKSPKIINRRFFIITRLCTLLLLLIALARPRTSESSREITVTGTHIMLALDVSGSMIRFDDMLDRTPRIDIAKREAISFIQKRTHDAIGLVLFAKEVVTRAPLTLDKTMLTTIINQTHIGSIAHDGTLLAWGLAAAINRLRDSTAKSKSIILLTDGSSSQGDADPKTMCALAKKLGIKIYTIAIGAETGGMFEDPFYGIVKEPYSSVNKQLLKMIADETGGAFFESQKPKDLATIYEKIDLLEKNELKSPLFESYTDYFYYFLVCALFMLSIELFSGLYRTRPT